MATSTIDDLRQRALEIKEETDTGDNTAERVGTLFEKLIDIEEEQTEAIARAEQGSVLMEPLIGINAMQAIPGDGQSIKFRNGKWVFYTPSSGGGDGGSSSSGKQRSFFLNVNAGVIPPAPIPDNYNAGTDTFTNSGYTWKATNVNPTSGQSTYIIWVWFSGAVPQAIDGPIMLFDGSMDYPSNGVDSESKEWVYMRTKFLLDYQSAESIRNSLANCTSAQDSNWSTEGKLPNGWNNHPSGIDPINKYEYAAYRVSSIDANGKRVWGKTGFNGPLLWSAYGEKGMDGDGVEYIFYANQDGYIPVGDIYDPTSWTNDEGFQNPEYIKEDSPWMDEPIDLYNSSLGQGAIEWVSSRKKQDGVWQPYSPPAVWSRLAVDGLVDGYVVDLSNENMPVGTDTEGHAADYSNICSVTAYHNGTPMNYGTNPGEYSISIGTITRSDATEQDDKIGGHITANLDLPYNPNDIIVKIDSTGVDNFQGKNAFIPITVTLHDGQSHYTTRNLMITMFGTVAGKDGNVIDLYTETASVHVNADRTYVIPSALDVGVRVGSGTNYSIKSVTEAIREGYSFNYFYDGDTEHSTKLTGDSIRPVPDNHTSLSIRLYKDGVRIDEERLPYVVDGKNGNSVSKVEPFYHADISSSHDSITRPNAQNVGTYWFTTMNGSGWNSTNKYLWMVEKTTYTNEIVDWGDHSLYLTWVSNGQGQFKSIVFCRKNSAPSTPSNSTSNDYNTYTNPIPPVGSDGITWSDGIPSGSASIWSSYRVFTSDGQSPQDANWSSPSKMQDSTDYDVEFSAVETNPGNPTDNPNNWKDPVRNPSFDFTTAIWRAEKYYKNGSWGDWIIEKIKGERGPEGASGYSIIMNPSSLIVNESITYGDDETEITGRSYDINYKKVTIQIKKKDTPQVLYRSNLGCYNNNNTTCDYVSAGAALSSDAKTLTVYISGISDSTITEGYIQLTVGVDSSDTPFAQTIKIPFYINRQESVLFSVKGELKHYTDEVRTDYTEDIKVTQKRLTSQFTESIGTIGSRNFFGFTGTTFIRCVPFIQGYGVVVNGQFNSSISGRIGNLKLNGIGGIYTVRCYMKAAFANPGNTINVKLCDISASKGEVGVNIGWTYISFLFELKDSDAEKGYIDFKTPTLYNKNQLIYVRHLKIERGDTTNNTDTNFCESDEDIANIGKGQLLKDISLTYDTNFTYNTQDNYLSKSCCSCNYTAPSDGNAWTTIARSSGLKKGLEAGKIYTLSFWGTSDGKINGTSKDLHALCTLHPSSLYVIDSIAEDIYTGQSSSTGRIYEGVVGNFSTHIFLKNQTWTQFFIHFYAKYTIPASNITEVLMLTILSSANQLNGYRWTGNIYYTDFVFQEGYIMSSSSYSSLIEQTARRMSFAQYTGTKKAGIDLQNGRVDVQADQFTITNNNGDVNMSVNETGDVEFRGTLKASYNYNACLINGNGDNILSDADYVVFPAGLSGTYYAYLPKPSECLHRKITVVMPHKFTVDNSSRTLYIINNTASEHFQWFGKGEMSDTYPLEITRISRTTVPPVEFDYHRIVLWASDNNTWCVIDCDQFTY